MHYAAPYKNRFYLSIGLAILLAVLSPIRPYLIQLTINDYVREHQQPSVQTLLIQAIITITVIQVVLLLVETGFRGRPHQRRRDRQKHSGTRTSVLSGLCPQAIQNAPISRLETLLTAYPVKSIATP